MAPQPYFSFVITPDEQEQHRSHLLEDANARQAKQVKQQQDEIAFKESLSSMGLADLMRLQKEEQDQADCKESALKAMQDVNMRQRVAPTNSDAETGWQTLLAKIFNALGLWEFAEQLPLVQEQQHQAERKAVSLDTIRNANGLAPGQYQSGAGEDHAFYWKAISNEDTDRIGAIMREKGISENAPTSLITSFSAVVSEKDPVRQLDDTKTWLRETFPAKPTDALLMQMEDKSYAIVSVGVSDQEVDTAKGLQDDKSRADIRSSEITALIKSKIRENSNSASNVDINDQLGKLATPAVKSQLSVQGRDS